MTARLPTFTLPTGRGAQQQKGSYSKCAISQVSRQIPKNIQNTQYKSFVNILKFRYLQFCSQLAYNEPAYLPKLRHPHPFLRLQRRENSKIIIPRGNAAILAIRPLYAGDKKR